MDEWKPATELPKDDSEIYICHKGQPPMSGTYKDGTFKSRYGWEIKDDKRLVFWKYIKKPSTPKQVIYQEASDQIYVVTDTLNKLAAILNKRDDIDSTFVQEMLIDLKQKKSTYDLCINNYLAQFKPPIDEMIEEVEDEKG